MLVKKMALERRGPLTVGELGSDLDTPISLFMKLRSMGANVLLESAQEGRYWGRYSFIGFGEPLFSFSQADEGAWLEVRRFLQEEGFPSQEGLPPFQGGLVGHISYDAVTHLEPVSLPEISIMEVPQISFLRVDALVVVDNLKGSLRVVMGPRKGSPQDFWENVEDCLSGPLGEVSALSTEVGVISSTISHEDYLDAVAKSVEYVKAGDVIQVVLAQILTIPSEMEPFALYRALRRVNPSPYMFYLDMGAYQLVGSSPEVMVRLQGDLMESRPIAGTRPRTGDPATDRERVEDLRTDEKEGAEHVMLVDLARNDLGRVAVTGSVKVTEFRKVESYSHVFHLVSHVEGRLRPGLDAVDLFRATFPAGTLSGAPKVRAMEIISELEPVRRGFYGGAVGYLDYGGNMDTCIAIRSLFHRSGRYYLGAGAGVVADSVPEREYAETMSKAQGMLKALGLGD